MASLTILLDIKNFDLSEGKNVVKEQPSSRPVLILTEFPWHIIRGLGHFRIAADVYVDGKNLADILVEAGAAIRYDGGKKIKNWCE